MIVEHGGIVLQRQDVQENFQKWLLKIVENTVGSSL